MTAKRLVPFLTAAFLLPVIPFMISRPYSGKLTSPSYPQGETIYESENDEPKIKVLMSDTGKIADIPLNEYIVSSVAAEMPAEYEPEALKAQAVAARSYTVYHMEAETASPGIVPEHKGAYICTDPSHCKAYITKEEMQKRWGDKFNEYYEKIYDAVKATEYETLSYNGRTANAVFHAISSGKTESAKDVWGSDIPYLVSADSLFDTESRGYLSTVEIDTKEFKDALESLRPLLTDTPNPVISHTESGGVKSIEIYGTEFTGSEIRSLFSLRSVNFELEIKDSVIFTVKGYGHGVGMSQFGAQQMALNGYSYKDILAHYYTGTEITQYDFTQKKIAGHLKPAKFFSESYYALRYRNNTQFALTAYPQKQKKEKLYEITFTKKSHLYYTKQSASKVQVKKQNIIIFYKLYVRYARVVSAHEYCDIYSPLKVRMAYASPFSQS